MMDECGDCGAVRPRWMGEHHHCMEPTHPYNDFTWMLGIEDDE